MRSPISRFAFGFGFAGALMSCGGSTLAPDASPDASTLDGAVTFPATGTPLPCDVDLVFANHCRECHTNPPQNGAPMPLLFQENLDAPARSDSSKKVYELVGARIHDDTHPMPQPPNARLSAADTKTLDDWIAAGAPTATTCAAQDGGAPTPDSGPPDLSCVVDASLIPATPWTMPADTEDVYVCYGLDVTPAQKRHVVGITPHVDNKTVVHHVLLFQSDTSESPTPTACDPGGSLRWRMLYGWAPGGKAMELPPEAGFAEEGTTHYVVQIHYSNLNHLAGQTDKTGFDLCTTDKLRPNDADVLAFGSMNFTIKQRSSLDITCSIQIPSILGSVHAFAAFPHMHKLGKTIETTLLPGGSGAPVDMGQQQNWDFSSQPWFPIDAAVKPGDVVKTRCLWENPGDTDVGFGSATNQEMCYSFTAYYPKIQSSVWSWALPANRATCVPTQ